MDLKLGSHTEPQHKQCLQKKVSFKNMVEFRGEVEYTGILLMINLVFQKAQRMSYRRKGKMRDGSENVIYQI